MTNIMRSVDICEGDFIYKLGGSSIDDAIDLLVKLKKKYDGKFTNIRFIIDGEWDNISLVLVGDRPENEKEKKDRLKKEAILKKQEVKQEKQDRAKFEELKQKYKWE